MKSIGDNQNAKIKGEHFCFSLNKSICKNSDQFKLVMHAIKNFVRRGDHFLLLKMIRRNLLVFNGMKENLVVKRGRSVLAERLAGGTTYTGEVTDGALGDGVAPTFTNASTQLNTEVARLAAVDSSFEDNIAYIDFFFDSGDAPDQTYTEWGTFIDGDGTTPNSGRAFSLLATGGWVKSGSMYVSSKYTII